MQRTRRPAAAERRARVMGADAHVLVVGGDPRLADRALERLADLERRWSRFLPGSEISCLNAAAGEALAVSAETRVLVTCGVLAWRRSNGLVDPTVHDALVAAGYDRDFASLGTARPARRAPQPAPGCAGIRIDDDRGVVQLPPGVRFDPGGIGKGLAADLVADELLDHGAVGALVNLGGDLRAVGDSPDGQGWRITVEHPSRGASTAPQTWTVLALQQGAVATSGVDRRRWTAGGRSLHHLIDPRTGRPAQGNVLAATAVAGTAWEAEIAAKAAVLAGAGAATQLVAPAVGVAVFDAAGGVTTVGSLPFAAVGAA